MTESTTIVARTREDAVSLAAELERRAKSARDIVLPAGQIEFVSGNDADDPTGALSIPAGFSAKSLYRINPTAHSQIADKLGIPLAYYRRLQTEHPDLLATNVNEWLAREDRNWLARTLDGRVRAVLSDRYRALDNSDLFFHTFKVARDIGAEIQRFTLTDDRFELRLIQPEWRETIEYRKAEGSGHGSPLARGFGRSDFIPGVYLSNSETGKGGLTVRPFILDLICFNGLTGEQELSRVHLGTRQAAGEYASDRTKALKDEVVWSEVSDLVTAVFDRERFRKLINTLNEASAEVLEAPIEVVDAVAKDNQLTDEDRQAILNELISPSHDRDPGRTVLGLISAITERAKHYEVTEPEKATELELVGARILKAGVPKVA